MQTPNVYVQTQTNPFTDVAPPPRTNTVDLLYVTDRQPLPNDDGTLACGYGRSPSLAFGSCAVAIGHNVSWDTLVEETLRRQRTQKLPLRLTTITEQGRFPASPLPFVLHQGQPTVVPAAQAAYEQVAEQFRQALRQRLAVTPRKAAYVYIHGFNNTFADAAYVIAELWHFLGRQGVPILYTWPAGARAGLRGYTRDRESGEFTIFHLKAFLRLLASTPELEQLHLIAHSRGTDVLTSALRELFIDARAAGQDPRRVFKLKNVVLAAADLDMDVVTQRLAAEIIGFGMERFTIYVSASDLALGFSGCLFLSFRRLGQLRPEDLTEEQRQRLEQTTHVQLIDARVTSSFIGHAYFYAHPAVSADLILLLRDQLEPGSPGRPLYKRGSNFWQITDEYPAYPGVQRR